MRDSNKPRQPIDIKRDSALSISIDEPGAKIEGMLIINHTMVIVSTKAVHQTQLADQIDPNRTNFNLPQAVQQKIISYGSEAPFIVQTLLMARSLFDTAHLGEKFDKNSAMGLALRPPTSSRPQLTSRHHLTQIKRPASKNLNPPLTPDPCPSQQSQRYNPACFLI